MYQVFRVIKFTYKINDGRYSKNSAATFCDNNHKQKDRFFLLQ